MSLNRSFLYLLTSLLLFHAVSSAALGKDTNLSIRSPGTVAEYLDQHELISREVNTPLVATGLVALGSVTYATCQATAPILPAIAATACIISATATFISAIFAVWKGLTARDLSSMDAGHIVQWNHVEMKIYYASVPGGLSSLSQLRSAYAGKPLLVGHHTCYGYDCFESWYSNHHNEKLNKTVHVVQARPRLDLVLKKRQDDGEGGSATDDSGEVIYVDYNWIDDNAGDEADEANADGEANEILTVMGNESSYTTQGYKCMTVLDDDDNENAGAQGYLTISQDYNIADPDNEDSYIQQCAPG